MSREFDIIFNSGETEDIVLEYKEVKLPIKVRELSWSEKNQVLSQCFTYQTDGTISFDFDKYNKLMLRKIIVQAPWGETNDIFLTQIRSSFGSMLEKLVPRAFEEMKTSDFFGKGSAK